MDAVKFLGNLSQRAADGEDSRIKAELLLLREFYVRWRRLHAELNAMRGRVLTEEDTKRAAEMSQRLLDQSDAIKAHQK